MKSLKCPPSDLCHCLMSMCWGSNNAAFSTRQRFFTFHGKPERNLNSLLPLSLRLGYNLNRTEPVVCSRHPAQESVDLISVGLFPGSLFCSTGLHVCLYACTTLVLIDGWIKKMGSIYPMKYY